MSRANTNTSQSSRNSFKELQIQIEESNRFYLAILNSILKVKPTPIGLHKFMDTIEETASRYLQSIQEVFEPVRNLLSQCGREFLELCLPGGQR